MRDDAEAVPDTNQAHILGVETHTSADCGEGSVGAVDVAGIAEVLAALADVEHHTALAWAEAVSPNPGDSCTEVAVEASVRNPLLVKLTWSVEEAARSGEQGPQGSLGHNRFDMSAWAVGACWPQEEAAGDDSYAAEA